MSNFEHCNRIEREKAPGNSLIGGVKSGVMAYWRYLGVKTCEGENLNPYLAGQMTTKWKLHRPNGHELRPPSDKFSFLSKEVKEGD